MAIKPKDLKFEEAALRKRLEFVRHLQLALRREDTLATQTVHAYTHLIDGEAGLEAPGCGPASRPCTPAPACIDRTIPVCVSPRRHHQRGRPGSP